MHGDVAQVEDVGTLEEFRGKGVARNIVLRAVDEARAAGASLVFLFADANDWPQHLYGRLGFDVARPVTAVHPPAGRGAHGPVEIPGRVTSSGTIVPRCR